MQHYAGAHIFIQRVLKILHRRFVIADVDVKGADADAPLLFQRVQRPVDGVVLQIADEYVAFANDALDCQIDCVRGVHRQYDAFRLGAEPLSQPLAAKV